MNGRIHRWIGLGMMVLFLASGFYLKFRTPPAGEDEVVHFLYRANHVYFLLVGLVNLTLGMYLTQATRTWPRRFQRAGSLLLVVAPFVLGAAFVIEPPRADPFRPLTSVGVMAAVIGVILHMIARRRKA